MMWFKDTGRIVTHCGRLSDAELGLLYRLINHAWQSQGITESDLPDFALRSRTPIECVRLAWEDFKTVSEEKDGKRMLPEQWEGVARYQQKVDAGKSRQERTKDESKEVTGTTAEAPLDVRSTSAARPLNRIEENRIEKKRNTKKSKSHSPVAIAPEEKKSWTSGFLDVYTKYHNLAHPDLPYSPTGADWGQLGLLKKTAESKGRELSAEMWERGVRNYFASVVGVRSICDLATYAKFVAYYGSPLNEFGKPTGITAKGLNGTFTGNRRESDEARRLREFAEDCGFISNDGEANRSGDVGEYGAEIEIAADDGEGRQVSYSPGVGIGVR